MRRDINEMYPLEIVNMVKRDSNEMEATVGVDLLKLIEEGYIEVVGMMDEKLLYQAVATGEMGVGFHEEAKVV